MTIARKHWALLAIYFNGGEPMSPVQLQKTLFLLGKECSRDVGGDFYDFKPYNYGPFDADVYRDASDLASEGLVRLLSQPWRSWVEYTTTPEGESRAEELKGQASERAVSFLRAAVEWARPLSFQQLVTAIYRRYPEQRANSVFQS